MHTSCQIKLPQHFPKISKYLTHTAPNQIQRIRICVKYSDTGIVKNPFNYSYLKHFDQIASRLDCRICNILILLGFFYTAVKKFDTLRDKHGAKGIAQRAEGGEERCA